jgi:spore germination cell wall hydrolase CwlJ-like protein
MLNDFLLAGLLLISPVNAEEIKYDISSVECLAMNMYHEARGQGTAGLLAVSSVVINRVKDKRFPNTICEVVKQGPTKESWKRNGKFLPIKDRCQFSWYCDGKSDETKDMETYNRLLKIAETLVYNKLPFIDITDGALFYHADYVKPDWAKTKTKTVEIQDHIFYKWDRK